MTQKEVSVAKLARLLELNNFTEQVNLKQKKVCITEINRPALQLYGYFEHFAEGRVQIIGMVEFAYLQQVTKERKREAYDKPGVRRRAAKKEGIKNSQKRNRANNRDY